jgi:hypothetical protein
MTPDQVIATLDALASEAHELAKGSDPAKPAHRTKAERLAALVERLSDLMKRVLVGPESVSDGEAGRPSLPG